jgi:outer membrane receptor protein involved in Fe transport
MEGVTLSRTVAGIKTPRDAPPLTRTAPTASHRQPAYNLVNAAISWIAPGDRFTASVWGKNLSNEIVANALLSSAIGSLATYQAPRTFGASVTLKL